MDGNLETNAWDCLFGKFWGHVLAAFMLDVLASLSEQGVHIKLCNCKHDDS